MYFSFSWLYKRLINSCYLIYFYKEFKCFKLQEPLYYKFISVLERFEFKIPKEPFIKLMPRSSYSRYGSENLQRRLAALDREL